MSTSLAIYWFVLLVEQPCLSFRMSLTSASYIICSYVSVRGQTHWMDFSCCCDLFRLRSVLRDADVHNDAN